jgi:hypothetical protein
MNKALLAVGRAAAPAARRWLPSALPKVVANRRWLSDSKPSSTGEAKASAASVYALSGLSESTFKGRKVFVYRPAKSAMQSGPANKNIWKLL